MIWIFLRYIFDITDNEWHSTNIDELKIAIIQFVHPSKKGITFVVTRQSPQGTDEADVAR